MAEIQEPCLHNRRHRLRCRHSNADVTLTAASSPINDTGKRKKKRLRTQHNGVPVFGETLRSVTSLRKA
jgi:hypothetical protein